MEIYLSSCRQTVTIDEKQPAFEGGQARLYTVPDLPDELVKLYKNPTDECAEKALAMVQTSPTSASVGGGYAQMVWPRGIVYTAALPREFRGTQIPLIRGKHPLNTLWTTPSPWGTRIRFKDRHLAGRNIALGVHALHEAGCVVGDLSPANILVGQDMLCAFIDTDSFQFRAGDRVYSADFGRTPYAPPEALATNRPKATPRESAEDCWALAILIFQLLMGSHPFTAHYTGSGTKLSQIERIKLGLWPYAQPPPADYVPSRTVPPFKILHAGLRDLTIRTFQLGHSDPHSRPSAEEWKTALDDAIRDTNYIRIAGFLRAMHGKSLVRLFTSSARPTWPPIRTKKIVSAVLVTTALLGLALLGYVGCRQSCIRSEPRMPSTYSIDEYGKGKPTPSLWTRLANGQQRTP